MTGGRITQADRSGWQQRAAAELAAILAAHPGIPVIAWTVTASGGALSGQVLAPASVRRGLIAPSATPSRIKGKYRAVTHAARVLAALRKFVRFGLYVRDVNRPPV